ncbi:MAG TPA: flagellar biosynthetic protein FliQ [Bryobacteraceae bacterium]|nr:flagellar biosynthetic protein FliQ [Bryobacteraceae bacterium]
MTIQAATDIFRQALMTTFWLSLPLLGIGLIAGILISLVQILTSIQDTAFGSVPRLAAFFLGLLLLLPWMITKLVTYTAGLLSDFSRYAQ